jgi:hypothetical protein
MKMEALDDPTLALIARFVVEDVDELKLSDEQYLQHQLTEIKRQIEKCPEQQQEQFALAWIREHAERYRRDWQKKILTETALDKRCADCPLIHDNSTSSCIIHERWVGLLKEYIAGEINSDKYIEETLQLLREQKNNLKVAAFSSSKRTSTAL